MFNVAVFKLKDVIKYLVAIATTTFFAILVTRFFRAEKKINFNFSIDVEAEKIIENQIPVISELEGKEKTSKEGKDFFKSLLGTQISAIQNLKENEESEIELAEQVPDEELPKTNIETEVVTNNPIAESFNAQYGNVKIKNGTSINLTEDILTPNISIENKNIIIYHTHSCESYTSSDQYPYTPTGTFRTTDLNFTVTRVGAELENQLKKYNIPVVHNTNYHDYPAYKRSLATVENILQSTPSDIIIDLHRDAIGSRSDYAPTVRIGEDYAAQIMFVMGSNEGGLAHPNWQQNLKFAVKVQEKAEELYPGLFKPIMISENRYNQHAGKYASIIEVGATGNTLEQCLTSMKYLAKVLDEVVN